MPTSTSSKISVEAGASAANTTLMASEMRDSSPPDATFASACSGWPGLALTANSTVSAPCREMAVAFLPAGVSAPSASPLAPSPSPSPPTVGCKRISNPPPAMPNSCISSVTPASRRRPALRRRALNAAATRSYSALCSLHCAPKRCSSAAGSSPAANSPRKSSSLAASNPGKVRCLRASS